MVSEQIFSSIIPINKVMFSKMTNVYFVTLKSQHWTENEVSYRKLQMKAESRSGRNLWAQKICSSIKMLRTEAAWFQAGASRLSRGEGPGFEWQGSVHSDWPHSSLSPPSSTGLQGGSGCCSSWSGRHSPEAPGCVRSLWWCCCPPPSSSGSSVRGSPRWPDTPVWHCPAAAPLGRGAGWSGWDAPHPLEETRQRREGSEATKTDCWC